MMGCVVGSRPVLLSGRNGLGDAIYTRAIARAVARDHDTYVATAWPELFLDLPVRMVRPQSTLYGPTANVARYPKQFWTRPPPTARLYRLRYAWNKLPHVGILAQMEALARTKLEPFAFDLPKWGHLVALTRPPMAGQRIAVVRPVTDRRDWSNPARNPDPAYVVRAAELLIDAGFRVVSIADLVSGVEDPLGELPPAHERFDHGELGVREILSLVQDAAIVVGGPGWIVPACLASGTPLVVIGGGQNGCNGSQALLDPRMDATRVGWLMPDFYCPCTSKRHGCNKEISGFDTRFQAAIGAIALGRAA